MKRSFVTLAMLLVSIGAFGDVSVTERSSTQRLIDTASAAPTIAGQQLTPAERAALQAANQAKRDAKRKKHMAPDGTVQGQGLSPADRAALRAANQAKRDAKHKKHASPQSLAIGSHIRTNATGSQSLIDASGLKYFINTNITVSTTSSDSAAASEASFTHSVVASTSGGGTTMSTLSDMYDGYNAICVSLTGVLAQCATGNPSFTFYNNNGPASFDATVPAIPTCTNRQLVFTAQTIGALSVRRKVFVPTNDSFIRWLNIFTNTSGAPVTFSMMTGNNLGSDSNTIIVSSTNGDNVAQLSDTWISTFQDYSLTKSTDPRIGHVMQGAGAPTPLAVISFADADDNPFWGYTITLQPGQTKIIMNFATGQGTKAAANAKAATLATAPASAVQCMSNTELGQVTNFALQADLSIVKTASAPTPFGGFPINYTLSVSNAGPSIATNLSVVDTLPAGVTFVSASGAGWLCNQVAGVVTCTLPTLAASASSSIAIQVTAPLAGGITTNSATVSSATTDPNPANNTSSAVVPISPAANIPTLSEWMLVLLALALATVGALMLVRRG